MRILVLEDNPTVKGLLQSRLNKEGFTVDAVDNGHQGFQLATSVTYDVILSDINMPHWDGLKFIEALERIQSMKLRLGAFRQTNLGRQQWDSGWVFSVN